jgi:hypothetical protein
VSLRGLVFGVPILARLDRDAIVAGVNNVQRLAQYVGARVGIEAVVVRPMLLVVTPRITTLRLAVGRCCQNGVFCVW